LAVAGKGLKSPRNIRSTCGEEGESDLEGHTMKRRTRIIAAALIAVVIVAGIVGTYYLTLQQGPDESIHTVPCEQMNDDNPWKLITTIIEENTTDGRTQGNFFESAEQPERVRMTWESSRPIEVMIVWEGQLNPRPLIWNHTATSAEEVVEINYTVDGKLHVTGILYFENGDSELLSEDRYLIGDLYLIIKHIDLGPEGVSYNLTIDVPRLWKTVVSCTAPEIHAGSIELVNSTFTAEERIRVTFSANEPLTVELRWSSNDTVMWSLSTRNCHQWFYVQAEDIGRSVYLHAHADIDMPASALSITIETSL
jgi:hypothetical protein